MYCISALTALNPVIVIAAVEIVVALQAFENIVAIAALEKVVLVLGGCEEYVAKISAQEHAKAAGQRQI